jgi:long-chain fatty acid transport protein
MYKQLTKVILCLIVTSSLVYSGGFQLNEHGAKALAQSGAFAARANDPSAMYFNPAGIAHLDGTRLMLGATLIFPDITFRGPYDLNTNEEIKASKQIFTPVNLHFTQNINDMFTAGFAVYNPYGLGTEWPEDWVGKSISIMAEIQLFNFNPTVAARFFNNKLSIGAGFDYTIGSVEMLREASNFNPPANIHLKAGLTDGKGYGYNFGIQYKPTPYLNFGISYRSPINVELEGKATFSENRSVFPEGKINSTLKLPANIFVAAAFSPINDLWFEFDAQFIGWSAFDVLEINFEKDNSVSVIEKRYNDAWVFRFGAEYKLSRSLTLSAGCFRDINPVPDETLDPMLPDSDRWGINLGVSCQITKMLSIDISYLFLPFDERTTNVSELGFNGTYNTVTHLFGLNINFNF